MRPAYAGLGLDGDVSEESARCCYLLSPSSQGSKFIFPKVSDGLECLRGVYALELTLFDWCMKWWRFTLTETHLIFSSYISHN